MNSKFYVIMAMVIFMEKEVTPIGPLLILPQASGITYSLINMIEGITQRRIIIENEYEKVWIRCKNNETDYGWKMVDKGQVYTFEFKSSILDDSFFWGNIKTVDGRKKIYFPVYNNGAPRNSINTFKIKYGGIYLKKGYRFTKFKIWRYQISNSNPYSL